MGSCRYIYSVAIVYILTGCESLIEVGAEKVAEAIVRKVATQSTEPSSALSCPKLTEYTREQQSKAAAFLRKTAGQEGQAEVRGMVTDYGVLRAQCRVLK